MVRFGRYGADSPVGVFILAGDLVWTSTSQHQRGRVSGWIDQQLISGHARRGEKLGKVKNIVVHYVANPGTSAQQNRDYFNNDDTTVSAHFLVGLEGEVIQCVPLDEKSLRHQR